MSVILDIASWALLIAGGGISILSGVGVLRFPDLFTRMHAASMLDTLGAGCVLLGLALQTSLGVVTFKLLLVFLFLAYTTSTAAHALAKSAIASGMKPYESEPSTASSTASADDEASEGASA